MAKMGRPKKKRNEKQGKRVTVNLTPAEMQLLKKQAKKKGISMAEVLLRAWRKGRK